MMLTFNQLFLNMRYASYKLFLSFTLLFIFDRVYRDRRLECHHSAQDWLIYKLYGCWFVVITKIALVLAKEPWRTWVIGWCKSNAITYNPTTIKETKFAFKYFMEYAVFLARQLGSRFTNNFMYNITYHKYVLFYIETIKTVSTDTESTRVLSKIKRYLRIERQIKIKRYGIVILRDVRIYIYIYIYIYKYKTESNIYWCRYDIP